MKGTSFPSFARGALLASLAFTTAHAHPGGSPTPPSLSKLTISLAPGDSGNLLARTVQELSDPLHARYGQHLSREDAFSLLAPSPEALDAVRTWLRDTAGLHERDIRQQGQFLHVSVSPSQSASLLKQHDHGGLSGLYTVVSDEIRQHVRAVQLDDAETQNVWHTHHADLSVQRPSPAEVREKFSSREDLQGCDEKLTPVCLREKYQMKNIPKTSKKTIFGVIGFNDQTAQHSDLDLFFKSFDPAHAGANFSEAALNGGSNPQGNFPTSEGGLDIQYAVALAARNVDVRFLAVGGRNMNFIPDLDLPKGEHSFTEPYLEFANTLAALPDEELPSVISISYGVNEQLLARDYAQHVCDIFGQLSTRGVSVLAASGDAGPGQSCQSNTGAHETRFLPAFPASCPYVTAVGATQNIANETAMALSGGGFSEYFPRPTYQNGAVDGYLARHGGQWAGLYNEHGRGIPDVAALGKNYQMYYHGKVDSADGTSASTPVVAAMIAVLNSLRAEKGKPALGFLNTWLYAFGRYGFTDITTGKSSGCPGTSYAGTPSPKVDGAGWPADHGWDAATGWGTPVFSILRRLACL